MSDDMESGGGDLASSVAPIHAARAEVMVRIGGREYPRVISRQCKVCRSPYSFDIDEHLILGRTYKKIADSLPEDADLSARNIQEHYRNGHLPVEQATYRAIVEERAEQIGKRIEDSAQSLIDGISLSQIVVQKTFEAIARGEIKPDVKDGMAAAKFLADLGEYDEGGADMSALTEAFIIYHENAEQFMSPEQFQAFGEALGKNPVLRALTAKYEGQTVEGEVLHQQPEQEGGEGP